MVSRVREKGHGGETCRLDGLFFFFFQVLAARAPWACRSVALPAVLPSSGGHARTVACPVRRRSHWILYVRRIPVGVDELSHPGLSVQSLRRPLEAAYDTVRARGCGTLKTRDMKDDEIYLGGGKLVYEQSSLGYFLADWKLYEHLAGTESFKC